MNKIVIKTTTHQKRRKGDKRYGRGVYAKVRIRRGAIIERNPIVLLPRSEVDETELADYCFDWKESKKKVALVFGSGSLFNHSFDPNAEWDEDEDKMQIVFRATQTIKPGEQIFINYNYPIADALKTGRGWYMKAAKLHIVDVKLSKNNRVVTEPSFKVLYQKG